MNLTPSFNLQRTSMVEVVTKLIQCNIPKNLQRQAYSQWEETEVEVVESKIQELEIPIVCKKALIRMVKPIFRRIRYANETFSKYLTSTSISSIHKCIRLTSWGTVDFKRSAEALLDLSVEELPKLMRYKLSRTFCLQDSFKGRYKNLDEADWMSLTSSLEHYLFMAASEQQNFSNFEFAVLNGNELAARHFWNAKEKLQNLMKLVNKINAGDLKFHRDTLRGLYLFLLSCYPDNVPLQEALLDSLPFLVSLFEWPYLDKLMELFQRMPEERRYLNMGSLIFEVGELSCYRRMDGDYVDTLRYFLKEFLATYKGLTTPNSQAGNSLFPYWGVFSVNCCEDYVRYTSLWDGWTSQWERIVIFNIDMALFEKRKCDGNNFRFVRLLLELLEESHIVRYCELRAEEIARMILDNRHPRLEWLFKHCLTNEQSKGIKDSLWDKRYDLICFNLISRVERSLNIFEMFCCMPHESAIET